MHTDAEIAKAFTDETRKELAHYIDIARKNYENMQAKFIADIQTNPASAIGWKSEEMVRDQTVYEVWSRIEHEMAEHNPREVIAENLKEVRYRIRSFFGSNSTSIFSNAVERAKAEAYVRMEERLAELAKHYGIEITN